MQLEYQKIDINQLRYYYKNPRVGNVEAIAESLEKNGQYKPIVVNRGTKTGREMEVLAGNHTLRAFHQLAENQPGGGVSFQEIEVCLVDVDDQTAARIVLADNRTADLGTYDNEALLELLEQLDHDLDGTGYDYDDLNELIGLLEEEQEEAAPDQPQQTLAERFGIPPFSVIYTTKGDWQARKKAWIEMGIASHEGRKESLAYSSGLGKYSNWYDIATDARKKNPELTDRDIEEKYADKLKLYNDGEGTSIFDPVLAEIIYSWFTKHGDNVLDPWAGGSVRGIVAATTGRKYYGHELRQEQVDANNTQWQNYTNKNDSTQQPEWITGDSRETMQQHQPGKFDLVIGCPPYYDLEQYSDDPSDLSNMDTDQFNAAMRDTLAAADRALKNDRYAVFVISSARDKKGYLRDLRMAMQQAAPEGWRLINEMVLVNAVGSVRFSCARAFLATRAITRNHQEVIVFVKGDRKQAAQRIGEPELVNFDFDEGQEV